ncbi:MAG: phosphotransferase [Phycisphaeraceae bacterium]
MADDTTITFRNQLLADGVIRHPDAALKPLTGGVSSEIYLVEDGDRVFVVKRALAQLRVKDEWKADVSRNRYEQEYLRVVGALLPEAVPALLNASPGRGYFAMEYLGDGMANWKQLLLAGRCDSAHSTAAGTVLGRIHARTWDDLGLRDRFDSTSNFHQLRTSPYLLTTGQRNPALRDQFEAEAHRVEGNRRALVHGDFSPKNIMIGDHRIVVLDCEVAWFGDPSFDVAFLLNHLLLKSLHRPADRATLLAMAQGAWHAYAQALGQARAAEVQRPLPTLLPMLTLARVDGKSPVEYLSVENRAVAKAFVLAYLKSPAPSLDELLARWSDYLKKVTT